MKYHKKLILILFFVLVVFLLYTSLTTARSSYVQNYCKSKAAEYAPQQNLPQQEEPNQQPGFPITGAAIQSLSALDETYLINCCEQQGCTQGSCTGDSQITTCFYYCQDLENIIEGPGEIQSCDAKYQGTNPDPVKELEKQQAIPASPASQTCGNGQVDAGEECDEGNTNNGDGCGADCKIENDKVNGRTWACKSKEGEKTICTRTCGSGTLDDISPETCDDGNTEEKDGCSSHCQIESGFLCIREPISDPLQRGRVKSICEKIPLQMCPTEPTEPCYDKVCFPSLEPCSSSENKCSDGKSICVPYETKSTIENQETIQEAPKENGEQQTAAPQLPPKIDPQQYKCPKLGQKMCVQDNNVWCCPPGGLSNLGPEYSYRLCPGNPVKTGFLSLCKDERAPSPGQIGECYLEQCRNSQKHIHSDKAVKK